MDLITKERIITIEKRLLDAVKNNDVENLDDLLHNDLLFHIPNGQTITKAMDLEAHRSGNIIAYSIAASDQVISIIDDTAVVSVLIETKGKVFNQPMEGKFRYIRVWKSFNNKLKVIAGSCIQLQ